MGRSTRVLTADKIGQVKKLAPLLHVGQLADYLGIAENTWRAICDQQLGECNVIHIMTSSPQAGQVSSPFFHRNRPSEALGTTGNSIDVPSNRSSLHRVFRRAGQRPPAARRFNAPDKRNKATKRKCTWRIREIRDPFRDLLVVATCSVPMALHRRDLRLAEAAPAMAPSAMCRSDPRGTDGSAANTTIKARNRTPCEKEDEMMHLTVLPACIRIRLECKVGGS